MEIIAHRGFSAVAPENTIASIEAALDAGADAVEFDLQMTRDGIPVLFHDDTLERTTDGTGPIGSLKLSDLGGLDAGGWFDPRFEGEPVPELGATLRSLAGRVGRVYPEIKDVGDPDDPLRILDVAEAAQALDWAVFISMDWGALDRMRAVEPKLRVGYIVESAERADEGLERTSGDPLSLLDFRAAILLDAPELAERAHAQGTELAVWTVDEVEEAARLLAIGVSRITTNQVARLLDWKATL